MPKCRQNENKRPTLERKNISIYLYKHICVNKKTEKKIFHREILDMTTLRSNILSRDMTTA